MSDGPRIPLADAERAAAYLFRRWLLDDRCVVVGSVRRRVPHVGDIEIIAPAWDQSGYDPLFQRIARTLDGEHVSHGLKRRENQHDGGGLFEPEPMPTIMPVAIRGENTIGRAVHGFRPGFLHARLMLRRRDGSEFPCEVYRYTPRNRGWVEIMRTGPRGFGIAFLSYWKHAFGIAHGDGGKASIDGHLVNAKGEIVDTPSEQIAFQLCGLAWIPPEERDNFAANKARLMRGARGSDARSWVTEFQN